jgi:hypothetical protein
MSFVTQNTDDFCRQRLIENLDDSRTVTLVPLGNGAVFDMSPGSFAQGLNICQKWFITHGPTPLKLVLGEKRYYSLASWGASQPNPCAELTKQEDAK